ncbi:MULTISPECIES: PHP domain-containing protein [unclassified Frigoribacterium]|uniref:PHP domain-containing protein n=1 Tax=unclassified Frigoribacterium TaxID=2627005 RepID=UPI0006FC7927|nr:MULTISPECIES: PHP domain-containing protein [unclassified Frigoribacterium]KQO84223.1 metal-dependent phosphoesterase [Frigoribacterium sp. Leaf263]KQR66820.1 metal-dependent phosphoesterase [Frigoribacterium sp. Leaf172]
MPSRPIDLHAHSSVSDGTETPAELVRAAVDAGLGALALTDHDSTAGWAEATRAVVGTGLLLVPGMELSTSFGLNSVHMLGYLFDPTDAAILTETARLRDSRLHRAERIVERIAVDYDITWQDVLDQSTRGATLGRPHIADALVARGFAPDRSAAFAGILHWRSGYYEPHEAPSPLVGIRLIREAGGVPVIAHPATRGREPNVSEKGFASLVEAGLMGVEIAHRENTRAGAERLRELAAKHDLIVTGSSDYHGEGKPNRLGENSTDPEQLERIVAAATGWAPVAG